jgi:hypothetical protein
MHPYDMRRGADREVVFAGLTLETAKAANVEIVTDAFPFRANGRAMTLASYIGFIRTVTRADDHRRSVFRASAREFRTVGGVQPCHRDGCAARGHRRTDIRPPDAERRNAGSAPLYQGLLCAHARTHFAGLVLRVT